MISWRLTQKHFFNENFGGAVINGRRNIFDTTLNLSGIAFLTEPRAISPLISRLRVRASENVDVEWDFDYDTGAKKFTSNNVLVDVHEGNCLRRSQLCAAECAGAVLHGGGPVVVVEFQPDAAAAGLWFADEAGAGRGGERGAGFERDQSGLLQYGAVQASYNWDCCGFSVKCASMSWGRCVMRTPSGSTLRLLNIGTAGNLRRAASLF